MRQLIARVLAASAISAMLALSNVPAFAKTVAECNADYEAHKDAAKAAGQTKKAYVAACRAAAATPEYSAPAAAPASAPAAPPAPAAGGKTVAQCNAEYAANKDAIKAGGQTKRAFVAACRSGTETIPAAAAPVAPAPPPAAAAPAPPPAAAAPAPQVAPAPMAPAPKVGAAGAGGFATDAQARAKCPFDTVVWVNTRSRIYHFAGTHDYGGTKQGTYMCEADAKAAGDRAAENEKHP
jgi:hypothetical protein